jgi:signal transduction histidine kinase
MTRTAAALDASRPHDPIPVPRRDDELGRLARTLNTMLERLRSALDEERRFAADASHELRTPLGVMEAELEVALRSAALPESARAVLASVREEVVQLARLVENLLVLSRAEARSAVELARRPVDLLELAGVVEARFRASAVNGNLDLTVEGSPAQAWADPELILQALANLVDNALKYTPPGGAVRILVADSGQPRVEVRDSGPGIPAGELDRVFERFYRVDRSRRRTTGGAGLGLAIARRLVEAHGGRIAVASEPGRGTTFTVWLPPAPLRKPESAFRESSGTAL